MLCSCRSTIIQPSSPFCVLSVKKNKIQHIIVFVVVVVIVVIIIIIIIIIMNSCSRSSS